MVPVRDGVAAAGGAETADECDGNVLLVGSGLAGAAAQLGVHARGVELGAYAPGTWAATLAPLLADEDVVVLPASPDGRDLAPRLAACTGRPLYAGAISVRADAVTVARDGGLRMHAHRPAGAFVATLQPGVRGVTAPAEPGTCTLLQVELRPGPDVEIETVLPADAATMDLAEAPRIVGGGAGLTDPDKFTELARFADAIGASVGATRVITDRGWVGHERQIGTTGVVVDPRLYVAFGISGAVQHTSGLGTPEHIISVNVDAYCPMMQLADLAVVSDANAVLTALVALVAERVDA